MVSLITTIFRIKFDEIGMIENVIDTNEKKNDLLTYLENKCDDLMKCFDSYSTRIINVVLYFISFRPPKNNITQSIKTKSYVSK